jgi:hypothetical protein
MPAAAYPPAVGILGKSASCTTCHVDNGPWGGEATIIDVVDAETRKSLRTAQGSFEIEVPRGETRTVLTVIGRAAGESDPPTRNAWLYVDPAQVATNALTKFAPGWDVNLPMSCRIVGDQIDSYPDAHLTVLPMTIRPGDAARTSEVELQVMLTGGEAVKGKAKEGLISNCFVRRVILRVED